MKNTSDVDKEDKYLIGYDFLKHDIDFCFLRHY